MDCGDLMRGLAKECRCNAKAYPLRPRMVTNPSNISELFVLGADEEEEREEAAAAALKQLKLQQRRRRRQRQQQALHSRNLPAGPTGQAEAGNRRVFKVLSADNAAAAKQAPPPPSFHVLD